MASASTTNYLAEQLNNTHNSYQVRLKTLSAKYSTKIDEISKCIVELDQQIQGYFQDENQDTPKTFLNVEPVLTSSNNYALTTPLQSELKMKFGASSSLSQDPSLSSSLYSANNPGQHEYTMRFGTTRDPQ